MEALALTLLGYPLSILASLTYDQLQNLSQKTDLNPLKELFLKAFYTSLDYHDKYYDEYSRKAVGKLRKAIKKDEEKLLMVFSKNSEDFNNFLELVKSREFQQMIAEEIVSEYSLDLQQPNLMPAIVTDCLKYYLSSFFNQMNEKEGIQAILIECLKLNTVLDILKKVDSRVVTKSDFDDLRKTILSSFYKENSEAKKNLDDYYQYIRNKFKYLELRGFSPKVSGKEVQMELLDIFVPLEINIDKTIMPNILGEKVPIQQRSIENDTDEKKKDPITSILEKRSLVILGDPGSGKSTLMKYLAVKVTHLKTEKDLFAQMIPIYFRVSDYAEYYDKHKKSIYEYITDHYDKQYQHLFKENFEYSNLLLLMDGLDEITDTPLRIRVTEQVMDLLARYPYNRYVVTSRIVGYQESKLGGDFNHFRLMPFRTEEIEIFSEQWYRCIAQNTDKDFDHASEQSERLYASISRNPSVIRLATNPLLMTIIAMIHYKGKKLPNKRVELYDISTETFLEYWVQLRMNDESQLQDKNELIEILAPIAFEIHQTKSNALIEEEEFTESFVKNFKNIHTNLSDKDARKECREFIKFLRQQTGFFYEKGVDDEGNRFYGFIHLTFEEYLAAIELVSIWSEGELKLEDYITNSRWTEIIRLAASQLRLSYKGRAGRNQSTKFIQDILDIGDPFPQACRPLQLTLLILSDDVNITDELSNKILDDFIDVISKSEFIELVKSFSKLLKEVFFSDYKSIFIKRLKKEAITNNATLRDNIMYILISNSWDKEVHEILISLLNRDERITLSIYKIQWNNFPFQQTECYKNIFIKKISYLKSLCDENEMNKLLFNYLSSLNTDKIFKGDLLEQMSLINKLEQLQNIDCFDIVLKFILEYSLLDWMSPYDVRGVEGEKLTRFLQKFSNNLLVKNLNKTLKNQSFDFMQEIDHNDFYRSSSSIFNIKDYWVLLEKKLAEKKANFLLLGFCSRNCDELFYNLVYFDDIPKYLKNLKSKFSDADISTIERAIYYILEPQEDSLIKFISAYEGGKLYDFFGWQDYPLVNINSNPRILSKIIIEFAEIYIDKQGIKNKIKLEEFNDKQIFPPVRLLVHHLLNKAYDTNLLDETFSYMHNCSSEEKKGTFSILYKVLNPFELS